MASKEIIVRPHDSDEWGNWVVTWATLESGRLVVHDRYDSVVYEHSGEGAHEFLRAIGVDPQALESSLRAV